jgi:hypothetical protein
MNLILNDSFSIMDNNFFFTQFYPTFIPGITTGPNQWLIIPANVVAGATISFNDALSFEDTFINQPLQQFNDALSFIDGFFLQLGSLLLLFDSDFFVIDDLVVQETITSLTFSDLYVLNDAISTGQQNGPSFNDNLSISDGIGLFVSLFLILGDDNSSIGDALFIQEGFVGEELVFNDTIFVQDLFQIHLPNVGITLSFNDNFSFSDSMTSGNVEQLNTYLRRYLNDVIQ